MTVTTTDRYGFRYKVPGREIREAGWHGTADERDEIVGFALSNWGATRIEKLTKRETVEIIEGDIIVAETPEMKAERWVYDQPFGTLFVDPLGSVYRRSAMGTYGIHHVFDGRAVSGEETSRNDEFFQHLTKLVPEAK